MTDGPRQPHEGSHEHENDNALARDEATNPAEATEANHATPNDTAPDVNAQDAPLHNGDVPAQPDAAPAQGAQAAQGTQPAPAPSDRSQQYAAPTHAQADESNGMPHTKTAGPAGFAGTAAPTFPGAQPTVEYPAFQQSAPAGTTATKRKSGPLILAGLAIGALVGGAAGAGVTTALMAQDDAGPSITSNSDGGSSTNLVVNDREDATVVTAVADETLPSVVTIQAAGGQGGGTGSGVILSEDGYVLTNTHVVTLDGQTGTAEVQVKTSDGTAYAAEIVGTDPIADLAVVKMQDASGLRPIEFADSSELNVGEMAIAIGAPLGLSGTVTNGIVSALNRSIQVASSAAPEEDTNSGEGDSGPTPFDFWEFGDEAPSQEQAPASSAISLSVIQTDAAINPGNSGGALLDADGRLIGINVAIASTGGAQAAAGSIGVGFAIPSNLAQRVAEELIEDGQASHGLLGAAVSDVDPNGAPLPVGGAYVARVTNGGAAAEAGIREGDIVTSIDGVSVTNSSDLTAQVRVLPGGTETEVTFVRDGEENTATVTLGEL